jgi:hypothetical protein
MSADLAHHDPAEPIASTPARGQRDDASERMLPVKIVRDYWASERAMRAWLNDASNRIPAGRVVELPLAEAKRAIAAGSAERADPLPEA